MGRELHPRWCDQSVGLITRADMLGHGHGDSGEILSHSIEIERTYNLFLRGPFLSNGEKLVSLQYKH